MNKIIFLLVTLVVIATSQPAWVEQECWFEFPPGTWNSQTGSPTARCRKFLLYNPNGDSCNQQQWTIPFKDSLSLAQWIEWTITGNRVLDLVRKPGTFAGLGPVLSVKSNEAIYMTFSGFENLVKIDDPTQIIPKYYAITPTTTTNPVDVTQWIAAPDMNTANIPITGVVGGPALRRIWEKIVVSDVNTACEYEDPAGSIIMLNLTVMKPWIDPTTGSYVGTLP